jgi:hypothetical protein
VTFTFTFTLPHTLFSFQVGGELLSFNPLLFGVPVVRGIVRGGGGKRVAD